MTRDGKETSLPDKGRLAGASPRRGSPKTDKFDELVEYWRQCAVHQRKFAKLAKCDAAHDEHMKTAHRLETWVARATGTTWEVVSEVTSLAASI